MFDKNDFFTLIINLIKIFRNINEAWDEMILKFFVKTLNEFHKNFRKISKFLIIILLTKNHYQIMI